MHQHGPDTQVLIVGNGPAGLSLSAFLSGVLPFYNSDSPHPDPLVHHKLSERLDESLIDQDLSWCDSRDELGDFSRPLSVLYDSLVRPGADLGGHLPSSLQWETIPNREVPHIVLGETSVGGSWNNYDGQTTMIEYGLDKWVYYSLSYTEAG
uniref:FAD_binding_3 domain-containing protein n=1 Tax=Heterorhabditis bacteriophora TaxID=37862 RepID=A0A1I7WCS0_HETBA